MPQRRNPVARAPLLRKGGVHIKSKSAERSKAKNATRSEAAQALRQRDIR